MTKPLPSPAHCGAMSTSASAAASSRFKFVYTHRLLLAYCAALSYVCTHCFISYGGGGSAYAPPPSTRRPSQPPSAVLDSPPPELLVIYSSSDSSVLLNTLTRHQRLVVQPKRRSAVVASPAQPRVAEAAIKFDPPYELFEFRRHRSRLAVYNLRNRTTVYSSQILQDQILLALLDSKFYRARGGAQTDGLFVEAGAYDGETWSNTLHLERFRNWTGLLVEPSADSYRALRAKNRNAYSVNSCLCAGNASHNESYIEAGPFGVTTNVSRAVDAATAEAAVATSPVYGVTCHPLGNILEQFFDRYGFLAQKRSRISVNASAHGRVIDYMSVDIEGGEREVLRSFPWTRFDVNLLSIEYNQNKDFYAWCRRFMRSVGFVETVVDDVWYQDAYFAHASVYDKLNLSTTRVSDFVRRLRGT